MAIKIFENLKRNNDLPYNRLMREPSRMSKLIQSLEPKSMSMYLRYRKHSKQLTPTHLLCQVKSAYIHDI